MLPPIKDMAYHPVAEQLVQVICDKTRTEETLFFRVLVAYYLSTVASTMRCSIATHDRGEIPVNMYAINLAPSGFGKGHSTSILKKQVLNQFTYRFVNETFEVMAQKNLPKLATDRAHRKATDPDKELETLKGEFNRAGALAISFNSGTSSALKQIRHKLLLANAGSLNFQMDEVGSNLLSNMELLDVYLELYDTGEIDQKITKNTNENVRNEEIIGRTPTNMLLFGTPAKLLNGSKVEEEFYSMQEAGFARRCVFGYVRHGGKKKKLTPQEVYDMATDPVNDNFLQDLADHLETLADPINMNKQLAISKDTTLELIEYQQMCEALAESLPEHAEMRKAEISHRYFKALKLAGAYAFIDDSADLTSDHLYNAIALVEESGQAFERLLTRDKAYAKLAKYIAELGEDVTHTDLSEDLIFYPKASNQRADMLKDATAWGYKNNIIIKKKFEDGIEFLRGESLKETDLNEICVSYSNEWVENYNNDTAPFDQLHVMTQAPGMHWVNHHMRDGYRDDEHAIPGFNIVVLDVDKGVSLEGAKALLKDYKALYYTTKRHTADANRFRIVLPTNYELKLDTKDYKEFMKHLMAWLPFEVDTATGQRARKWESFNGHYEYTDGELLDVLPFIPKTSKNEEHKQRINSQQSLDNLERWVINNTGDGNRNNQLLKYAYILVDGGFDFNQILGRVKELNDKLPDKLDETEIHSTIMVTVGKALANRP